MEPDIESVKEPVVSKLRDRLVTEMTTNPDLYDECDLERVKTDDWTVRRFLLVPNATEESAFTMARDAMIWRKSYGVNCFTETDFPLEFFKIGALFTYEKDRGGRNTLYFRVKVYKDFPKFTELLRQFLIYLVNKTDTKSGAKGFVMIWDMSGAGPSNWDLSMVKFIISSLRNYFPWGTRCLYICGIPWIMNAFINIVMKLTPEDSQKKVKMISKEQLFQYIAPENLPDFLDGTCDKSYKDIPKGVKCATDLVDKFGITPQEVNKLLKYYEKELK